MAVNKNNIVHIHLRRSKCRPVHSVEYPIPAWLDSRPTGRPARGLNWINSILGSSGARPIGGGELLRGRRESMRTPGFGGGGESTRVGEAHKGSW